MMSLGLTHRGTVGWVGDSCVKYVAALLYAGYNIVRPLPRAMLNNMLDPLAN